MKRLLIVGLLATMSGCSDVPSSPSLPPNTGGAGPGTGTPGQTAVLAGAGDIGMCGLQGAEATARLLDRIAGTIFTTGDHAYPSGSEGDFRTCYDPTWGRHRDRTRPTPGNHDYDTSGASPYYAYFGASAGPAGLGYYSYMAGAWLIVALNSETDVRAGSPQVRWLEQALAQNRTRCAAAYWHRPLFSSGSHGNSPDVRDVWQVLYEAGVDVVVNGHEHFYERFAPQAPDGRLDPRRGIRQFTVGTGGGPITPAGALRANSEVTGTAWGVLVLTLNDGNYQWEFRPVAGESFADTGVADCH
jgi:hypothetical protein